MALLGGALVTVGAFTSPAVAISNTLTKTTTYNVSCTAGVVGTGTEAVTTTQTAPSSVTHGTKFAIKWKSKVAIAKTQDEAAWTLGARSFKGTITNDVDNSSDASPKAVNIAGTKGIAFVGNLVGPPNYGPAFEYTPLPTGAYATTPSFTAGAKGTDKVSPGVDDATATLYTGANGTGTAITTITVNCSAPSTPVIIDSVPVS
jgi:hypothetical protein